MDSSVFKVYILLRNLKQIIFHKKNIDVEFYHDSYTFSYKKCNKKYIELCQKIYNNIENNYYNYKILIISFLYYSIFLKHVDFFLLNTKSILSIKKMFSSEQLNKDNNFIIKLMKKMDFKDIAELCQININGESIIYKLVIKQYIGLGYILYLYKKNMLTINKKDVIFKTEHYQRFERILEVLNKIY